MALWKDDHGHTAGSGVSVWGDRTHVEDRTPSLTSETSTRHLRGPHRSLETEPLLRPGGNMVTQAHRDVPANTTAVESGADNDMGKRVLGKIDRTIIPLLFVTYMFNFMDKAILSSAAVFGLPEDNVSSQPAIRDQLNLTLGRIFEASSTAGLEASSTLAIWSGSIPPPYSLPASPRPSTSQPTPPSGVSSSPSQRHAPALAGS